MTVQARHLAHAGQLLVVVEGYFLKRVSPSLRHAARGGFDREVDNCAAYLYRLVKPWQEGSSLLNQNQGTEFALVVFKKKAASFELDLRVAAGDGDIVDPKV